MTILATATVFPSYNNETDCRGCHGSDVSDRHHFLVVNGTFQCTDCHPIHFDNVTQSYTTQAIRNCLICHPGKNHTDVHHILVSRGLFVCSDCHPIVYNNVSQTYSPKVTWDCPVCHSTVLSIQNITVDPTPTPTPTPTTIPVIITNFNPVSPVNNFVGDSMNFHVTTDQITDITWSINGTQVQSNGSITDAGYTNTSAVLGTWNVSATASNIYGNVTYTWIWIVTSPPPPPVVPTINSYFPLNSPVNDAVETSRKFGIAADQIVNIEWYINDAPVQNNNSIMGASYNNTSASIGSWNVKAVAINANGSITYSWIWNVADLPSPGITSYSPISPVNDTEGASETFSITTNQTTDITWYINGTPIQSNGSIKDARYTNISASSGTWNVSAIATNSNGTVMSSWTWNVIPIPLSPPAITSSAPPSPVNDIVGSSKTFNITTDQIVNVTWYINGISIQSNNGVTNAGYTNISALPGIWNVSAIATNANGSTIHSWTWNVTAISSPPIISNYSPISPLNDIEGSSRIFNITTNQTTNIVWYINDNPVQSNNGVMSASYTNTSASAGIWNVTANATNANGSVTYSWIWNVTANPKPITTIDPSNGKNGWYMTSTIYLNATDNNDIKYTNYSIDGGVWISNHGTSMIMATPIESSMILKTPVVLSDGIHSIQYYSADNLNGIESTKIQTVKIDKTPPQITINSPVDGSIYILNQNLIANWSVNDSVSGIATTTGTYPSGSAISTTSIGTKSFSVSATDNAGNTNKKNITYYVRYNFSGFLQPIDTDGSSIFKLGSKVNVRFRLSDAKLNNVVTATAKFYFNLITPTITGRDLKSYSNDVATIDGIFKYDSKNMWYWYNLDTKGLQAGTWRVRADISDGSSYTVNISLQK